MELQFCPELVEKPRGSLNQEYDMISLTVLKEHQLLYGTRWGLRRKWKLFKALADIQAKGDSG